MSFSAGVDAENFADTVACGFAPVTTCTDLLQAHRLPPAAALPQGARGGTRAHRRRRPRHVHAPARGARRRRRSPRRGARQPRALRHGGRRGPALRGGASSRRHATCRRPLPRFDCADAATTACVVCPNDAFFSLPIAPVASRRRRELRVEGGAVVDLRRPVRALAGEAVGAVRRRVQRVRQLRHVLPRERRPAAREAALPRDARALRGRGRRGRDPARGRGTRALGAPVGRGYRIEWERRRGAASPTAASRRRSMRTIAWSRPARWTAERATGFRCGPIMRCACCARRCCAK